ncbi:LAME_0H19724g1_1 [Lachancea meyersii CBS 8951]|uniref:LAME_0H19724g1_1 n=1 Tax=Lachancea meyersii CBS 8951 TaxID=1266667 RepID=A0A1G4KJD2_9SACH|nr:LAME_0H19724g1_1 [Lachancea meyersii CBS 8951]
MRTFIKSHRKSSSVDSSPSRNYSDRDRSRSSNEYSDVLPPLGRNSQPHLENLPSQSTSSDSIQKLTNKNKIFSTRIFKKPGSSHAKMGESTTAPTSPFLQTFRNLSSPENTQNWQFPKQPEYAVTPAIKGTRMHEWGPKSKERSQSVILLNRNLTSSDASSDVNEPGLRSSVRFQTGSFSSVTSSTLEGSHRGSVDLPREKLSSLNEIHEKHPYSSFRPDNNKSKNRQARIHSHEDFLCMERNSTLDLSSFTNTFNSSPTNDQDYLSEYIASPLGDSSTEKDFSNSEKLLGLGVNYAQKLDDEVFSVISDTKEQSILTNDRSFEEGDEISTSSHNGEVSHQESPGKDYTSDADSGDEDSFDDGSSDGSSRFSFEAAGVNGRTASVKYYSKPAPQANLYVDDLYKDDDFDEDMNYFDEEVDDAEEEVRFSGSLKQEEPGHNFHKGSALKSELETIDSNESDDIPAAGRGVNNYNDLFNISDEEDDSGQETGCGENEDQNLDTERIGSRDRDSDNFEGEDYGEIAGVHQSNINSYGDIFDISDNDEPLKANSFSTESPSSEDPETISRPKSDVSNNSDSQELIASQRELFADSPSIQNSKTHASELRSPFTYSSEKLTSDTFNLSLPPPARSQVLKYHDLMSNLDYEVPGTTSNLYFIDESEEDKYNQKNQPDEHYLDEVNRLPEDYDFSDDDDYFARVLKSPGSNKNANSFKKTHSFSSKPLSVVMESLPANYKLELKDKVVTFFHSPVNELENNPLGYNRDYQDNGSTLPSPREDWQQSPPTDFAASPITPSNSLSRPTPYFNQSNSLSPIQENNASVDSSPRV